MEQIVVFFHTSPTFLSDINFRHLHLFNGQNVFARRRLAAEHGIKFGFVVKPKITASKVRYFLDTHEPLQKNRMDVLLEQREIQEIQQNRYVRFSCESQIKAEVAKLQGAVDKLNRFFTPEVSEFKSPEHQSRFYFNIQQGWK